MSMSLEEMKHIAGLVYNCYTIKAGDTAAKVAEKIDIPVQKVLEWEKACLHLSYEEIEALLPVTPPPPRPAKPSAKRGGRPQKSLSRL